MLVGHLEKSLSAAIVSYGEHFKNIVEGKAATDIYASTGGAEFRRFGRKNFQILEILLKFTEFQSEEIDKALEASGIPKILIELMVSFPWHNLMHNACTRLFSKIIHDYPLSRAQMFDKEEYVFGVLARTAKDGIRHRKHSNSDKTFNKGYLGQLKAISRIIEQQESEANIDLSESKHSKKQNLEINLCSRRKLENLEANLL